MSSRQLTQESFDAIMQAKAKRYRLERNDPIDEALHHLRVHSRPTARSRFDEEEDFQDDRKYVHRNQQEDSGEGLRDDFSLPSYRSGSRITEDEDYYAQPSSRSQEYSRLSSREQDYSRSSSGERGYGGPSARDRDFGRSTSQEWDFGRLAPRELPRLNEADYESSELLRDFRSSGLIAEEFGAVRGQDYNEGFGASLYAARKHSVAPGGLAKNKEDVSASVKKRGNRSSSLMGSQLVDPFDLPKPRSSLSQRPHLPAGQYNVLEESLNPSRPGPHKELKLDLAGVSDIFTTFGIEIIKWAGFHEIKKDPEYMVLYRMLFTLGTETCAKMLASFKCSLKPEHQDFCFSAVRALQHAALRTPKVDNQFLNLLLEEKVIKTKNCFFEVIKHFDRYIMRIQDYLLKSTTPLLMACNTYELSLKSNSLPAQMPTAFETTVSLCRKSLALLGQTFALASTFRQEKILEAIGIQEAAPPPSLFPNFDTSALFGKEYIEHLQGWLKKSGVKMQLKKMVPPEAPAQGQKNVPETRPKIKIPQRADRKVTETIEKFVNSIISGTVSGKERAELKRNPEYWFLHEEDSLEHKYYQLKLAEMERLMSPGTEEAKMEKNFLQRTAAATRILMYLRKVSNLKRKLYRRRRAGILTRAARARKAKMVTVGTQTLLSATKQKPLLSQTESTKPAPGESASGNSGAFESGSSQDVVAPEEALEAQGSGGSPANSVPLVCQFPDVDPKTMITAEKLAKFVAEVGPEIEQFSIDNSADNPDLWFLQDRESSAFKFYRMKVRELCPTIRFSDPQESAGPAEGGSWENLEGGGEDEEEEEEDEEEEEEEEEEETPQAEMEVSPEDEGTRQGSSSKAEDSDATGKGGDGAASEGTLSGLSVKPPTPVAPFRRKRISSKSLKVGLIPASKRVCLIEEPKVHDPVRIAYDRPRGYQPYKNKKKSKELEFAHKRLNQRNIGFQMLQKMGWKEGLGLGLHGKGIKDPVKVGSTSAGEGLGVAGEENKEDTFATFRQRMIQMYYLKRASK